jgi:thiamine biosynthesis lipoprotein ApbE
MTQAKRGTPKRSRQGTSEGGRLTREEACDALAITPELLHKIERSGALGADADGRLDPLTVGAAAVRYGLSQADAAERKLAEVGAALSDVKPALERLAALADRAELSGDTHNRVMVEVAAFFNAFAGVMNRATAALKIGEDEA